MDYRATPQQLLDSGYEALGSAITASEDAFPDWESVYNHAGSALWYFSSFTLDTRTKPQVTHAELVRVMTAARVLQAKATERLGL